MKLHEYFKVTETESESIDKWIKFKNEKDNFDLLFLNFGFAWTAWFLICSKLHFVICH